MARIVLENEHHALRDYPLYRGGISIGRGEENTIVLSHPEVSGYHARIDRREAEYILIDLQSTNGTLVNGRRIFAHRLSHGDRISVGKNTLLFISTEKTNVERRAAENSLNSTVIVGIGPKHQKTAGARVATIRQGNVPEVKTSHNSKLLLIASCAVVAIFLTIGVPVVKYEMLSLKKLLMSSEQNLRVPEKREPTSEQAKSDKSYGEYPLQQDISAVMPPGIANHSVKSEYKYDIEAIVWSSDSSESFVVVRGIQFRTGDFLEEATITEIGRDYIALKSPQEKSIVRLTLD